MPRRVAKLDDDRCVRKQQQEVGQQRKVAAKGGWELKQKRPAPVPQHGDPFELRADGVADFAQPFDVRDEPVRLDGKAKSARRRVSPFCYEIHGWKSIERVVDLHGAKCGAVVMEHAIGREILGVKGALPLGVAEARGASVERSHTPRSTKHAHESCTISQSGFKLNDTIDNGHKCIDNLYAYLNKINVYVSPT